MTENSDRAALAAARIRDLAQATSDPRDAYESHADIASVTGSLLALAQDLEAALQHLAQYIERHDDDWDTVDEERRRPSQVSRAAGDKLWSAKAQAHNLGRALTGALEAFGRLRPAP
ncbi:hypothetical protein ACFW7J_29095 [Streptomyces sp. NPDC059525]|uniref:hypothetical protein n=1 Tax=Streptomyces sp. NPDC059525 TaxID=3346857 RepID=UPI00367FEEF0